MGAIISCQHKAFNFVFIDTDCCAVLSDMRTMRMLIRGGAGKFPPRTGAIVNLFIEILIYLELFLLYKDVSAFTLKLITAMASLQRISRMCKKLIFTELQVASLIGLSDFGSE